MSTSNSYQFQTRWSFSASPQEICDILQDPLILPQWWPSVYLEVRQQGEDYHLHTRGWLPYTLRWSFCITHSDPPRGFSLRAWGDLEGQGVWTLTEVQPGRTEVVYDWRVDANKPLLRLLSPLFKPFLSANHSWAMERGRQSLEREIARRRGEQVGPPPLAIDWSPRGILRRLLRFFGFSSPGAITA